MCGVFGYIGNQSAPDIIFAGLRRLEYRGYDSAGIAVMDAGSISIVKEKGKLDRLAPLLEKLPQSASVGIGHTRWATHGSPSVRNAHPHGIPSVAIVHNGIIENYKDLRAGLVAGGVELQSDTDTEVILHILADSMQKISDPVQAICDLTKRLTGAYSVGIVFNDDPNHLYIVKHGSPLVIGIGTDENYFSSDPAALIGRTNRVIFLDDGQIGKISKESVQLWNFENEKIDFSVIELEWNEESVEKRGFSHYMLKEIHEQSAVMARNIELSWDSETHKIKPDEKLDLYLKNIERIDLVACGTAYYSCCVGKYLIERFAGIPVNVDLASEYRYRNPVFSSGHLVVAVSQSGETMDTLESIKHARRNGAKTLAICNAAHSSIVRECDKTMMLNAGPEIGVASTKAFTAMVLQQIFLACRLAKFAVVSRPDLEEEFRKLTESFQNLPTKIDSILNQSSRLRELAEKYFDSSHFLCIGRGLHFPIALEAALKIKEISYIHAEGYAAGELKHGPIALVDDRMPVLALLSKDHYADKTLSNIEQIVARQGRVVVIGPEDLIAKIQGTVADTIVCPQVSSDLVQPILSTIPVQLFSYFLAVRRGTDVDQPRNLAKSVTVE